MIETTVVIPCRDAAATLADQLAALVEQQDAPAFEVVVVDNKSKDDLEGVVASYRQQFPLIRIVRAFERDGVNYARNSGIAAASAASSYILICDADDIVGERWVAGLVDALLTADLATGPRLPHREQGYPETAWRELQRSGPPTSWGFLPYAVGSNLGARLRVFERIGSFDESLAGGGDDVEFSWRAQLAGCTLSFAPEATIEYRVRDTLSGLYKQTYRYGRGSTRVVHRYADRGARPPRLRGALAQLLSTLLRTPLLLTPHGRGQWTRRLAFYVGVFVEIVAIRGEERRRGPGT